MTITIPDEVLTQAQLSPDDLRVEIAALLYARKALSMGRACRLAGIDRISFQKELAKRDIYIHYDLEDLQTDLRNLGMAE